MNRLPLKMENLSSRSQTPITIVTACSSSFFDRLRNFVGSVHFWSPTAHVVVYDIGLLDHQIREVEVCCVHMVTIISCCEVVA